MSFHRFDGSVETNEQLIGHNLLFSMLKFTTFSNKICIILKVINCFTLCFNCAETKFQERQSIPRQCEDI